LKFGNEEKGLGSSGGAASEPEGAFFFASFR
jgi:hypothetical protein